MSTKDLKEQMLPILFLFYNLTPANKLTKYCLACSISNNCGVVGRAIKWIHSLKIKLKVLINGSLPYWSKNKLLQRSVLGLLLLNILTNGLEKMLSSLQDDSKVGGMVNIF